MSSLGGGQNDALHTQEQHKKYWSLTFTIIFRIWITDTYWSSVLAVIRIPPLYNYIRRNFLLCSSYAARESPSYADYKSRGRSSSRSTSPENKGKVEFITSFGVDSDDDSFKPVLGPVSGASAKSGLKRLREISRKDEVSGRKLKEMGPMLPDALSVDKKSRSVHKFFRFFVTKNFLPPGFVSILFRFSLIFRFGNKFYFLIDLQWDLNNKLLLFCDSDAR